MTSSPRSPYLWTMEVDGARVPTDLGADLLVARRKDEYWYGCQPVL